MNHDHDITDLVNERIMEQIFVRVCEDLLRGDLESADTRWSVVAYISKGRL